MTRPDASLVRPLPVEDVEPNEDNPPRIPCLCPCEHERHVDPWCHIAGQCARGEE